VCLHRWIHKYVNARTHTYVRVSIQMYVYKCMYICTYIYIYIYAFICIHINTLAGNDDRYAFKPNGKKILCLALAEARGKYTSVCVCVSI